MSYKHITIDQLTNIEVNFRNGVGRRDCARRMKLGKDKICSYYKQFECGLSVLEVYNNYLLNRASSGRKKIVFSEVKLKYIEEKLSVDQWSLDAIAGRDKLEKSTERCSTATLYRMVDDGIIDVKLLLRKDKKKYLKNNPKKEGLVKDVNTIHERNLKHPNIEEKDEFGHFEGDTIIGKDHASAVITLDDRASKYRVLLKSERKSEETCQAITNWSSTIKELLKSLTLDRGSEFAKWKLIEENVEVYFGDPGSPCQRGLNEHNNGITRRDLPKGTDLSIYTQEQLNEIAEKINKKPRKILGYKTAKEVLKELTGFDTILV